jgi:outer membrane lipoprotein-sorting protein
MRILRTVSMLSVAALSVGLTGCYKTIHYVPQVLAPSTFRTTSVDVLQKEISDRDAAMKTLFASVEVTASISGGKGGKVTVYTPLNGYILLRKPSDFRILLLKPVLGSRAVDMVSDGKTFTTLISGLTGERAITGTNTVKKLSENALENLRPAVFLDALLVPGIRSDEFVTLTESNRVIQSHQGPKQQAFEEPDYDLTISKVKTGHVLQTIRVVHINRIDMLPFQQDIYDEQERVVTSAAYENYQNYGKVQFPSRVTIKRPSDGYALKIDVTKLKPNETFEDEQFELEIPKGVAVQKLD